MDPDLKQLIKKKTNNISIVTFFRKDTVATDDGSWPGTNA